jgi:hypothetical protein
LQCSQVRGLLGETCVTSEHEFGNPLHVPWRPFAMSKVANAVAVPKAYVGSRAWRANSAHASASSKSFCLSCASGIAPPSLGTPGRTQGTWPTPQLLAGASGSEITHYDLGKAIGIALARQAQVDDLGHQDFRQAIRRWQQP